MWLKPTQKTRQQACCLHCMGYSLQLAARDLLFIYIYIIPQTGLLLKKLQTNNILFFSQFCKFTFVDKLSMFVGQNSEFLFHRKRSSDSFRFSLSCLLLYQFQRITSSLNALFFWFIKGHKNSFCCRSITFVHVNFTLSGLRDNESVVNVVFGY